MVMCVPCRDDLMMPRSPYFPVESAGQERGPSPMVMERFQSVVSQLFQHVREYWIVCSIVSSTRSVELFCECNVRCVNMCTRPAAENYPMRRSCGR